MTCVVCNNISSKYKCPRCRILYCSINCWTIHKKQECTKLEKENPNANSTLEYYSFKTEDTVPIEKLKLLEQSEGVRNTLRNPHVRSILNVIDKSKNPSSALRLAMLEPIFVEFVEECLKVIESVDES
ncbi:hypothetical protein PGB90_008183 [Kerria lacca]